MQRVPLKNPGFLILAAISLLYFVTHLVSLTLLPVFADEAIYIRWSQLIMEDWRRYLFFPLNDGKTPLHMWLMIPFLKLIPDPLLAGRLLSVLVGWGQVFVIREIISKIGGKQLAQTLGMLMVVLLPFWYFHHRLALIDGLFTLFLSLTLLGLIRIAQYLDAIPVSTNIKGHIQVLFEPKQKKLWQWVGLTGLFYGLAFLSKLPAIFFAPVFPVFILYTPLGKKWVNSVLQRSLPIGIAGAIGVLIFLSLRIHPAFGQLFSRGGDFTRSVSEIISLQGASIIQNGLWVTDWFASYVSYSLLIIVALCPLISKNKRQLLVILFSGLIFLAPFIILGKTIFPRYLLPVMISLTVLAAMFFEHIWNRQKYRYLVLTVFITPVVIVSGRFLIASLQHPQFAPFPWVDKQQYVEEWSAGYGIPETVEIIEDLSKQGRVMVLTEGYFGTLPDALLMYFHNKNVENIAIHGIGAPVRVIPQTIYEQLSEADTILLVVNSHRFFLEDDQGVEFEKLYSFERIPGAPTLDVYQLQLSTNMRTL